MRTRVVASSLALLAITGLAGTAHAQGLGDRVPADRGAGRDGPDELAGPRTPQEEPPLAPGEAPPARTGFQIALRLGPSIGAGKVEGGPGTGMATFFAPLGGGAIDIGAKVIPRLFVGATFAGAFGGAGSACDVDCSANVFRAGLGAMYSFLPASRINPWAGLGVGWEWARMNGPGGTLSFQGPEFGRASLGFDVRVSRGFGLGPYAEMALGRYDSVSLARAAAPGAAVPRVAEDDIGEKSLHAWTSFGVRVVANP